jgi:hypothetical protein
MNNIKSVLALFILLSGLNFSQQVIGKIYSNQEADNLYGPVLSSVSINSFTLSGLLSNSTNYIMFRIANGSAFIVDNNRYPLYSGNFPVNPNDVFRVFSISLVYKLLQDGNSPLTYIESRNNGIVSITNGPYTLEYGNTCPPFCL